MALARVYCGLASADDSVRSASAAPLTIAVVDDAGRLLGVHEISDDPGGYAELGALLVERTSGFTDVEVAADSDDHVVTSLLTAAGRPLAVTDDDSADEFAERFADDQSPEEIQAPPAARRAVGLARALQAGAITAAALSTPRELISYKPVLAAHVALLTGRQAAAIALREVLRELYPAALRAFADPAHPLALAVLGELPEPSLLTRHGDGSARVAEDVAAKLTSRRAGTEDETIAAVTALHVAISDSPRRGGINKSLAETAADAVRHSVAAVVAANAGCAVLVDKLTSRGLSDLQGLGASRRTGAPRRLTETGQLSALSSTGIAAAQFSQGRLSRGGLSPAASLSSDGFASLSTTSDDLLSSPARDDQFGGRPSRLEPTTTGNGPAIPRALTTPPVAPEPMMPPPLAPRPVMPPPVAPAAAAFPSRTPAPGNRPVSVPPPPPGMKPISPAAADTSFSSGLTGSGLTGSGLTGSGLTGSGLTGSSLPGSGLTGNTPAPPGMAPITPGTRPAPSTRTPLRPGVRPSAAAQTSGSEADPFSTGSPVPGGDSYSSTFPGGPAFSGGSPFGSGPAPTEPDNSPFGTNSPVSGGSFPTNSPVSFSGGSFSNSPVSGGSFSPNSPVSGGSFSTSSPLAGGPTTPTSSAASVSPAESGQPFRATLTNAAITSARAERQRTVIPPRPTNTTRPDAAAPPTRATGPTDFSLPMPAPRPETAEPGSRANWPLINNPDSDEAVPTGSGPFSSGSHGSGPAGAGPLGSGPLGSGPLGSGPVNSGPMGSGPMGSGPMGSSPADSHLNADGRVRPPWQDMPKEPPALRLVETDSLDAPMPPPAAPIEPPPLRVIDGDRSRRTNGAAPAPNGAASTLTALDRSITPPVPEGNDGDLLIFAAARSAWFTGHSEEEPTPALEWANPNDSGWQAAEKAAQPQVTAETSAGLPKRVPQANLVPGSPMRDERPLRIVRDAASIAAHTTGYFRGWRRGQEIGGFAMGGRPGREAAGGWDFTRDGQPADEYHDSANYGSR